MIIKQYKIIYFPNYFACPKVVACAFVSVCVCVCECECEMASNKTM